jgi:hypothetical protein
MARRNPRKVPKKESEAMSLAMPPVRALPSIPVTPFLSNAKAAARAALAGNKASAARKRRPKGHRPNPITSEVDYTAAELEFGKAIQAYKLRTGRLFPTNSELLCILTKELGYTRMEEPRAN